MLEMKIYTPYLINHSTIIQFQKNKSLPATQDKVSIMDIMQSHKQQKKMFSRLYFKVKMEESVDENFKSSSELILKSKKSKSVEINIHEKSSSSEDEDPYQ